MNKPFNKSENSITAQTSQDIVVGLSGGVDSSVAAYLLKQQGHRIQAVFMKNWEEDDTEKHCTAAVDLNDAQKVSSELNIELTTRNFSNEYWDNVFQYFLEEYNKGRTPNPDIVCNQEIKFKVFLDYAINDLNAQKIATGHYARIEHKNGYYRLLKAVDQNKDQTYFLYTLNQAQLSRSLFPLGNLTKPEVRSLAGQLGFDNSDKKDSTGICFIGERNFKVFLQRYLPENQGEIHSIDGEYLGKHDGLMYYTLGQRQGLGIGGQKNSNGKPWYVTHKNIAQNTLIVAQGHNHPSLFSQQLYAKSLCWTTPETITTPFQCFAKTRYRQKEQACTIETLDDGQCFVTFPDKQWAVTPGQSVVFYNDDECIGGGIIETT